MDDLEELKKLAEAATLVPKEATFDETVNDLAWRMHHFLMNSGASYDGRVFNNMKAFLRDAINEWIARSEMPAARSAIPALIERVEKAEAEVELLRKENGSLIDENSDLRCEPWPEWASAVLKVIRDHSGYDGYDDAIDGVDLPAELGECFSALESLAEEQKSRAEAAEAENARLREAALSVPAQEAVKVKALERALRKIDWRGIFLRVHERMRAGGESNVMAARRLDLLHLGGVGMVNGVNPLVGASEAIVALEGKRHES